MTTKFGELCMKKIAIAVALVLVIIASGCVSLTYDVKVDKNGEFDKFDTTMNTSTTVYSLLNENIMEEKGKSLRQYVVDKGGKFSEVRNGDTVEVKISGVPDENVTVEQVDGYMVYNVDIDSYETHYYLEMPGKIIESNADVVNGNKAEWHILDGSTRNVYAKSEIPTIPELGFFGTTIILLIAVFGVRKRCVKRED